MPDLPATLINFNLYSNAATTPLLGVVNCTLPNLTYMVDNFKTAGYGGATDLPIVGMFQNMRLSVRFTVIWTDSLPLIAPKGLDLVFRAGEESVAFTSGGLAVYPSRVAVKAFPLGYNIGTGEPGQQMGNTFETSVRYVAIYMNGREAIQIDQAGLVCKVEGVDYNAALRAAI